MADIRSDVGIITEVVAGEEGDEFEGETSTPNRIVLTVPRFKWPLTIGWFGHSDLCEALQELSMAGTKVKCTYLHTDPVKGGDGEERRYRNLIQVETKDEVVVVVPDAADAAENSSWGSGPKASGGGGPAVTAGPDPVSQRLAALAVAADVLGVTKALTGKWPSDIGIIEAHARDILTLCGADESVVEGFVKTDF